MTCTSFPACGRCSQAACDHVQPNTFPHIPGVCIGYIGWADCGSCGQPTWLHSEAAPHNIVRGTNPCEGYVPPPGEGYEGGGGGFGGGGATGGWGG